MSREFAADAAEWGEDLETPGILIWRIENMKPVAVDPAHFGKFFTGDAYIILKTEEKRSGALSYNLHFWLGSECSMDESGAAAYKTVELDSLLGGKPVQYREVQNHESNLFMSYFDVQYMEGGVESGFKHVERDVYEPRLLHIKGKRRVRVSEVKLACSSLNQGDVFILDLGLELYLWIGSECNKFEKAKGVEMMQRIRNDRGAKPELYFMDDDMENEGFWSQLEGDASEIMSEEEGGSDESAETVKRPVQLFQVSDASGELEITEIPRNEDGRFTKDMLDSDDVFILDADQEIFAWIGKGTTPQEKREAMKISSQFISSQGRPTWIPITRISEDGETAVFRSHFDRWTVARELPKSNVAKVEKKDVDVSAMFAGSSSEEKELDIREDNLQIWRVENFELVELPEEQYGQFYSGDSYVLLHTYKIGTSNREEATIYFWQGRSSSTDEKGASALLASDLDKRMGGMATQVRVIQGKEPIHFQALFKGKMVVHLGGIPGGFDKEEEVTEEPLTRLYHVKGTTAINTKAVEVKAECPSLNSGDCFVLKFATGTRVVVWQGVGANEEERSVSFEVAGRLSPDIEAEVVIEGEEDETFFEELGGKTEYAKAIESDEDEPREPRLFQCCNATGNLDVEEIFSFTQDDLCDDDIMLLDCYTTLFVWVGTQSNDTEKRESVQVARGYIAAATDGRDKDSCQLIKVNAQHEPRMFTQHFHGWDSTKAKKFVDPYEARRQALRQEKEERDAKLAAEEAAHASTSEAVEETLEAEIIADEPVSVDGFFTYEQLKSNSVSVDPICKQDYLSDKEFVEVFGMTKDEFAALKKWRQDSKKREVGLF